MFTLNLLSLLYKSLPRHHNFNILFRKQTDVTPVICAHSVNKQDGQYQHTECHCTTPKESHFSAATCLLHTAQNWDAAQELCPGGGQDMKKTPNDKITPCASSLCLQDGIHLPCDGSSFHLGPAWQGRTRHSTKQLSSLYWEALVLLTTASHHNPVLFFSASRHPRRCYVPRSFRDYL